LSPLYWKLLSRIPAFEVLCHRFIWAAAFLLPLLFLQGRRSELTAVLKDRRSMGALLLSTLLLSANWYLFLWAINHDQVLQASLGYYINPLVSVFLGMLFLGERLRRPQKIAVVMAGIAVTFMTIKAGVFPWISLALAFLFGFYGLIRKMNPVMPVVGLTVEMLLMCLPAAYYLVRLDAVGGGAFLHMGPEVSLLLAGTIIVTAFPLLFFNMAAKRLNLATVGFLQYIAPSCQFLLAVFAFHEPFTPGRLAAFVIIWSALALYSADAYLHHRRLIRV
jgi:chloramphenicol-sensitive protein RarD